METGDLSPRQRAAGYRNLAASQLALAGRARLPEIRATHLELAAMWTRLAEEAERRREPFEPASGEMAGDPPDAAVEI